MRTFPIARRESERTRKRRLTAIPIGPEPFLLFPYGVLLWTLGHGAGPSPLFSLLTAHLHGSNRIRLPGLLIICLVFLLLILGVLRTRCRSLSCLLGPGELKGLQTPGHVRGIPVTLIAVTILSGTY